MLLKHKSNGREFEMPKKDFELFSKDQQRQYSILNKEDNITVKQVTKGLDEKPKPEKPAQQ